MIRMNVYSNQLNHLNAVARQMNDFSGCTSACLLHNARHTARRRSRLRRGVWLVAILSNSTYFLCNPPTDPPPSRSLCALPFAVCFLPSSSVFRFSLLHLPLGSPPLGPPTPPTSARLPAFPGGGNAAVCAGRAAPGEREGPGGRCRVLANHRGCQSEKGWRTLKGGPWRGRRGGGEDGNGTNRRESERRNGTGRFYDPRLCLARARWYRAGQYADVVRGVGRGGRPAATWSRSHWFLRLTRLSVRLMTQTARLHPRWPTRWRPRGESRGHPTQSSLARDISLG